MKTYKIALCLPLVGFMPLAAHADPQPDPAAFTASVKKKPHYKKVAHKNYKIAQPAYQPAPYPVAAAIPAYAPRPYDWSGFFVGGFAGAGTDSHSPQLSVPTSGVAQGNDIGFAGSNLNNSYSVLSQPYYYLSNGANSGATLTQNGSTANINTNLVAPGYTSYTATATSANFGASTSTFGASNNLGPTTPGSTTGTASFYNLNGDATNSQLTTNSSTHRQLGMLGGELGYRKQFGQFVLGVEADGGYIDGRNTQTTNSTGQFSNSQGANTVASANECTTITNTATGNGNYTNACSGAVTPNSSTGNVTVVNNGNSSFSQSIQAGPQWLGTARLTAGVAMDRALFYATGGFAYGEADLAVASTYRDTANSVCSGSTSGTAGNNGIGNSGSTGVGFTCNGGANGVGSSYTYSDAAQWSGSNSRLLTGFAVGSGMAYALTDNIIFKLEGYYYNLGSISTTAYGTGTQTLTVNSGNSPVAASPNGYNKAAVVTPYSVSRSIDGFIAKVGVQFKFDTGAPEPAPVVAKY